MSLLPWHQPQWHDLVRRQHHHGLPHALLFNGRQGIGKHRFALHVAQWRLCSQPHDQGPCGQCHSCLLWQAGTHPDMLLCQPEDGSRQIRIDAIRHINQFLAQTPQISACQVVVIRPLEVMNLNAANALLKTLEEPPGESLLLLETERIGSVLPTLRSRCQRIVLVAPDDPDAHAWLIGQGIDANAAALALRFNPQAPLLALHWCQTERVQQVKHWQQQLTQWSERDLALQAISTDWAKLEFIDVIAWLHQAVNDWLKQQMGISPNDLMFADLFHGSTTLSGATVDKTKLIILQKQCQALHAQLLSGHGNVNKTLTIESLLLDWRHILSSSVNSRPQQPHGE